MFFRRKINYSVLKRSLQVLGIGTFAAGVFISQQTELAITPSLLLRHARTVAVVASIVLDYHFTLDTLQENIKDSDDAIKAIDPQILQSSKVSLAEEIKSKLHLRSAFSLLKLFKENGGVYIKLGQHLSSLVYLIPTEYTTVLADLQDHCPACRMEDVERVFREDMGVEMKSVFDWVDKVPVGSASLAAVYKASLGGKLVAIKVQHHYLDKQAAVDIKTCAVLGRIVKYLFPSFQFDWLVEEMAINLPLELDFVNEGKNAEQCAANFVADSGTLVIPKVQLATRRLLVMDFIEGGKVNDMEYLAKMKIDPRLISSRISKIFLDMIFKYQFLHCDPHSGNLMVRPVDNHWLLNNTLTPFFVKSLYKTVFGQPFQLVLLDHGLYRKLNSSFITDYANFWISLLNCNEPQLEKYCFRMFRHDKRTNGQSIDYHRLFASMVSGRSWDSLFQHEIYHKPQQSLITSILGLSGIANTRTVTEKTTIQRKAGTSAFLTAIMLILSKCPRELLLVMKTNDLIRSIYLELGGGQDHWHLMRNLSVIGHACLEHVFQASCRLNSLPAVEELKDYSFLLIKLVLLDAIVRAYH